MKKILTVSLVAMMAVSTARAEIASTTYVTNAVTNASDAINETIGTVATGKTVVEMIEDAQSSATYDDTTVKADIKGIKESAYATSGITSDKVGAYDTHVADGDIHVTAAQKTEWSAKQDAIDDLVAIRTGAAAGATAVQPAAISDMQVKTNIYTDVNNKISETDKDVKYPSVGYVDTKIAAANTGLGELETAVDSLDGDVAGLKALVGTDSVADQIKVEKERAMAAESANSTAAAGALAAAQAAQSTADKAVVANTNITAGTATKITYDAKGLVTKGESLTKADIPTIDQTQVSGLQDALGAKVATSDFNTFKGTLGSLATKSTIVTGDITDGAVVTAKIADDAVTTAKIAGDAVTTAKIADNAVTTAKIADSNVTKAKLESTVQESLNKADSAMQASDLKALASWTEQGCGTAGTTCSLIATGGTIAWEKVAR